MRTILLVLCMFSVACGDARRRELEQQVEKQQQTIKAQQDEIASLRARLTEAESKQNRREAIAAKNKALMASVPTPPPAPASQTSPPSSGALVFPGGTPGIDVQKASDFSNATAVIARHCGTTATCAALQREALAKLTQGRPANADERAWSEARVRCARENPEDYAERVRCEQRVPR